MNNSTSSSLLEFNLNKDKYLFIYNFLMMKPFSKNDIENLSPANFPFFIGCISNLQNQNPQTSFQHWLRYIKRTVKTFANACDYPLTDIEKELYPYAIALKTYPKAKEYISETRMFSTEKIESFLSLNLKKDEQKWAFYIVGSALLYALEAEKNFRPHLFIGLMEKLKLLADDFSSLEEKFNSYRIGKGIYE